jgi:hypothetical protein
MEYLSDRMKDSVVISRVEPAPFRSLLLLALGLGLATR